MNWFAKFSQETQPWQMSKDEYVGSFESDHDDAWYREYYDRQKTWEDSVRHALSMGFISPGEAKKKGLYRAEKAAPLPDVLYHVTTAKDKVMADRLKTRGELGEGFAGLGGGPEDTISTTADLEVAKAIYDSIIELKRIVDGGFDIEAMLQQAKNGRGADRPWIDDIYRMYRGGGSESGKSMPPNLLSLITGEEEVSFNNPVNNRFVEFHARGKDWVPDESTFGEIDAYGNKTFKRWTRKLTTQESDDGKVEFYKRWSSLREYAGGNMDPLFWGDSMMNLKNIPEDQIAVIRLETIPGAMGERQSALGEWRAWTGDVFSKMEVVI